MSSILDKYKVFYNDKVIGYYYIYSNHKATYYTEWGCPWDMEDKLKELGLEKELQETNPLKVFTDLINDANRVPGRRRILYQKGPLLLERYPIGAAQRKGRRSIRRFLTMRRITKDQKPRKECANGLPGMLSTRWMTERMKRNWTKPGGGAAATMTAAPSAVRYQRNGLSCPTRIFWRK